MKIYKTITFGILLLAFTIFYAGCGKSNADKLSDNGRDTNKFIQNNQNNQQNKSLNNNSETKTKGNMEHLTTDTFKKKVFNYDVNKDWKFEGDKPCIIDFYADWCGPCKMVAPVLSELSDEYAGKINIYKVDTDAEQELAGAFGIRSIPSILFVPMNGQPQMSMGAMPKESFEKAINDILQVKNN